MAKNTYISFFFQFLCWMLFFQVTRLIFVLWNQEEFANLHINGLLLLPFKAMHLDAAMSCYFMVIPWLLCTLALFAESKIFLKINQYFTGILIIVVSILTIGELAIYDEWHTKLNLKAVSYLRTPSEVINTATTSQLVWGALAISLLSWLGIWMFKKLAHKDIQPKRRPWIYAILFSVFVPGLLIIGLRGGLQQIPIQISDAYYSKHNILNVASTNSCFHLMSSIIYNSKVDKPYQFMPDEEAAAVFSTLHLASKDSTTNILTISKPNIVMVILEGWSADIVESCGGYEGVTPNLEKLINNGVFFSNCYANGERSDQGMVTVFSGFPAQPRTSIIWQPNKYERLPCILSEFRKHNYNTSFLFGGQLSYGNIRAYMYFNGFDKITEGKDFAGSIPRGKLGVADEYLFDKQLQGLSEEKKPFFAAMFTGSTHSPYDIPMKDTLLWGGKEQPYLNSAYYADKCLHDFMEKAKETSWYKNTLFVFISDHSHRSPKNWSVLQPESRKIPLLFYGAVIKPEYRGIKDTVVASQIDLASTLLGQLDMETNSFPYSKNLFNPYSPRHALYSFDEGICTVKPTGQLCWHVKDQRIDFAKTNSNVEKEKMVKEGQAYLQVLVKEYFSY